MLFGGIALILICPSLSWEISALLIISGMFGDFLASVWKRCVGVKDASTIFGSHGGIMDRCDSHAATFVYR
eukprot:UN00316